MMMEHHKVRKEIFEFVVYSYWMVVVSGALETVMVVFIVGREER